MADGSVINVLSGTGVSSSGASARKTDRSGDKSPFLGLLRTLTKAAEADSAEPGKRAESNSRNAGRGENELSPKRKEAIERVAVLTADGSIDREQLEDLPSEEWKELEEWVLDGAGGVFPQYDVVERESAAITADSEPREMLLDLLSQLLTAVQAADAPETEGEMSIVAESMGLGNLTDGEIEEMANSLLRNLAAVSGDAPKAGEGMPDASPVHDLPQVLGGMSHKELVSLLAEAAAAVRADVGDLESLPPAVLRSLAIEVLDVMEEDGGVVADLLRQLSSDDSLRQRLTGESLVGNSKIDKDTGNSLSQMTENGQQDTDLSDPMQAGDVTDHEIKPSQAGDAAEYKVGQEHTASADSQIGKMDIAVPQAKQGHVEALSEGDSPDQSSVPTDDRPVPDIALSVQDELPVQVQPEEAMPAQTDAQPKAEQPVAVETQATPVGETASGPEPQLSDAARAVIMAENIERVEQVMKLSVRRGLQQVTLQLSPPELGKVKIKIQMRQGVMSAVLQTDTSDARNALLFHVEQLRQSLEVQGIELDKFDVQLDGHQLNEGDSGQENKNRRPSQVVDSAGKIEANDSEQDPFITWHDGSLNLVV